MDVGYNEMDRTNTKKFNKNDLILPWQVYDLS